MTVPAIEELAERVDRAVANARGLDEAGRTRAMELKTAIEEFHKDGLTRIVRRLKSDPRGKELLLELAEDPAVYTLFLMHGLVRNEPSEEEEPPAHSAPPVTGFVPLASLTPAPKLPGWVVGPRLADLVEGKPYRLELETSSALILKLNGAVKVFRNECAHQGLPLDGGMVDREACTITCPWHGFRFDASSGECLTSPQAQLETMPMKIERDLVWVQA
jgi:nitrite reductase/ring-hydroxylating ferredoxin subunit